MINIALLKSFKITYNRLLISFCCLFFFGTACKVNAQVEEERIKASLIFYISDFIDWSVVSHDTLKLGLLGLNETLRYELNQIAANTHLRGQSVQILYLQDEKEITDVDIVYVTKYYHSSIKSISEKIAGKYILLFTYNLKLTEYATINLTRNKKQSTLSFQVNKPMLDKSLLTYDDELIFYGGDIIDVRELYKETEDMLKKERDEVQQLKEENRRIGDEILTKNNEIYELENKIENNFLLLNELNDSILYSRSKMALQISQFKGAEQEYKEQLASFEKVKRSQDTLVDAIQQQRNTLSKLDQTIRSREQQIDMLSESNNRKDLALQKRRSLIRLLLLIGFGLILIGILILRAYALKRKYNKILEEKVSERTHDLEISKEKLEREIVQKQVFENELIKSERRYRQIFNASTDAILILTGTDAVIVTTNESGLKILGYESEKLNGVAISELCLSEEAYGAQRLMDKLATTREKGKQQFEWKIKRGDGNMIWCEVVVIYAHIDEKDRFIAAIRDVNDKKKYFIELEKYRKRLEIMVQERTIDLETANEQLTLTNSELHLTNQQLAEQKIELENTLKELKDTQQMLVHSEKLASLGVFIAGIAHEINNPVNYISSGAQALPEILNEIKDMVPEQNSALQTLFTEVHRITEIIDSGVEKTTRIITSLRNYSRTESNHFVHYNVVSCLEDALILLNNNYKYHVTITKELPDNITIECIPGKINQVFVNIISNATQAIKEKGTVHIKASTNNKTVTFIISDSGTGISKEAMERIFDPFFTTKEVGKGTGLGLYIVHGIIQQHHGEIRFQSNDGNGTTATIELPITQPPVKN